MSARVTDADGHPVPNVQVQFREEGPAIFTPQGGSTVMVLTDANGVAAALLDSDVEGTSSVAAEISPPGTTDSFRGSGSSDDECEQPAGPAGSPPAGNCVSNELRKSWIPPTAPPVFQCDDGLDNDNDGFFDVEEDPGCESESDDSELPVDPPTEPERVRHDRTISIRFNDGTGARNNGLVVFGRLRAGAPGCISQQPLNVQRRVNGVWVTKRTTTTNRRGRYAVEIFDQASRYRAVAPRTEILEEDLDAIDICRKAIKAKRHRHSR